MNVQVGTHFVQRILAEGAISAICGIKTQKGYRLEGAVLFATKAFTWAEIEIAKNNDYYSTD